MYHMHHIIPRHMGGSDDESNLIKLTIEEHAEAHRKLYEEHGKLEDKVAWKSLLAQMNSEEMQLELSRIGGLNNSGVEKTEEHKKKISESLKKWYEENEPNREKISEAMKGNTNSKNHSSDEYKKKQSEAMKAAWARRKPK